VFTNDKGHHNLNAQLSDPMTRPLATPWEKAFAKELPGVLHVFAGKSKSLLAKFQEDIEARNLEKESGEAAFSMLGSQLQIYQAVFATVTKQMVDLIDSLQRDANREFTPVIVAALNSAYAWCASQIGIGQSTSC
jgi:hypothetical protein